MLEHAALLDAGGVLDAEQLDRDLGLDRLVEADDLEVEVEELAAHRMPLLLLDDDRLGLAAVEGEVEQRTAAGERVARLALGHAERARLGAARVDDAGNEPVAAQAAGRARAEFGAFGDLELWRDLKP